MHNIVDVGVIARWLETSRGWVQGLCSLISIQSRQLAGHRGREEDEELVAVIDEVQQRRRTDSPRESMSNGYSSAGPSPEPLQYFPHLQHQDPIRGEIEVNEASLKANTPLLVRSSSDSALAPAHQESDTPPPEDHRNGPPELEIDHVLRGALERLRTDDPPAKMGKVNFSTLTRAVEFPGNWGPLGIHVVPYCSSLSGRTLGLHIKGIEGNSRAKKEISSRRMSASSKLTTHHSRTRPLRMFPRGQSGRLFSFV
ncbi:Partitioning defective 3-like protein B [Larimichthys crocea]|uniref:Partitioning defective 3-like protein B n=1 Tax=Larimichthys crocea TaxID=215358 RepID=A0A6G0HGV6_LARCR|nr:Partitioning defective 3-like protein B [Larimichthys crocea]